jgi:hypothetical protein
MGWPRGADCRAWVIVCPLEQFTVTWACASQTAQTSNVASKQLKKILVFMVSPLFYDMLVQMGIDKLDFNHRISPASKIKHGFPLSKGPLLSASFFERLALSRIATRVL